MKGMDIFCASQAATAICLSMDDHHLASSSSSSSSPSSSSILLGAGSSSPAIDRCNPIITDSRRLCKAAPALSQPQFIPKPPHKNPHKRKTKVFKLPRDENDKDGIKRVEDGGDDKVKVSVSSKGNAGRKSWSCTKPGDFFSPPGSTRYLLGDNRAVLNGLPEFNPLQVEPSSKAVLNGLPEFNPLQVEPSSKAVLNGLSEFNPLQVEPSNEAVEGNGNESQEVENHQEVVLRVSLHCRGCERKMRKHISRMEGVTSFDIDFAAKKVTVSGKITPMEVLSSISKVKNAQLWSPTMALPTYTNLNYYYKNGYKGGNNTSTTTTNNNNDGVY